MVNREERNRPSQEKERQEGNFGGSAKEKETRKEIEQSTLSVEKSIHPEVCVLLLMLRVRE